MARTTKIKKIRYFFEGILLWVLFGFFKLCSVRVASNIGGYIGRTIGPRLAASRKARKHIRLAMPKTTQQKEDQIITGMWDNLGRVIAEYPHLEDIGEHHTTINNLERLKPYLDNEDQAIIFIGAHLSNWEVNSMATLKQLNHPIDLTYRAPNNPWAAYLLNKARTLNGRLTAYPKSRESGRFIMKAIKDKKTLGILIDQKYNPGLEVNFFSQPAMTNPIFVSLAQKYKCALIPVRNQRVNGHHFNLTPYPPLKLFNADGSARPVIDVIKEAHSLLEAWIADEPEQWIWLHKRWKNP